MNIGELKKELEKYGSLREKVLRLNEIGKFKLIIYGSGYVSYKDFNGQYHELIRGGGGCRFCHGVTLNNYNCDAHNVQLKTKNCNVVAYYTCNKCKNKKPCTYCLREKQNCIFLTKQKITFWLCFPKIPKDIRKLITNLFFKNWIFLMEKLTK